MGGMGANDEAYDSMAMCSPWRERALAIDSSVSFGVQRDDDDDAGIDSRRAFDQVRNRLTYHAYGYNRTADLSVRSPVLSLALGWNVGV